MEKNFWPVFIIVAALGAAAVWTQTPKFVQSLPDGMRGFCRTTVRRAMESVGAMRRTAPSPKSHACEPEKLLGGGVMPETPQPQNQPQPQRTEMQNPVANAAPPPQNPVANVSPPANPVQRGAAPADIKGVHPVAPASADWCVLTRATPIEALDGKPLGTGAGGRFFLIERRARAANGTLLIGNFTPKRLSQPVQILHRYALCLSGSPDDLSTSQLHALKMYYQLRGEAVEYLDEVRRTNGDIASPFWRKLVEAERIRDFRDRELRNMRSLGGDQRAVEAAELEKLKAKAADIRRQHEDWKRSHSVQIADPTKDPHYISLAEEYRRYASSLPAELAL